MLSLIVSVLVCGQLTDDVANNVRSVSERTRTELLGKREAELMEWNKMTNLVRRKYAKRFLEYKSKIETIEGQIKLLKDEKPIILPLIQSDLSNGDYGVLKKGIGVEMFQNISASKALIKIPRLDDDEVYMLETKSVDLSKVGDGNVVNISDYLLIVDGTESYTGGFGTRRTVYNIHLFKMKELAEKLNVSESKIISANDGKLELPKFP